MRELVWFRGLTLGPIPIDRVEISIDEPQFLWIREHGTLHITDVRAQNEFPTVGSAGSWRSFLATPLRQHRELIGLLNARRIEVRPFTPAQIKLLETFADQAVIAIENVRLFQELTESLEQQTATSQILGVIASSPTDIQPVLDTIAENAARLCEADDAQIFRSDGDLIRLAANYGGTPATQVRPISRGSVMGRIFVDRKTLHIHDLAALVDTEFPEARESLQRSGQRTYLGTPLLREGVSLGAIGLRRKGVRPFTDRQVKLLETFASQAVIAIENVRLFNELDTRNRQLTEALEQQTATSEILRVIASSPTDIQPVLDVVAENAARLCDANDAQIYRVDGDMMCKVARYGTVPDGIPLGATRPISRGSNTGRAIIDRQTIHVHDMQAEKEEDFPDVWQAVQYERLRTALAVPLLREGAPIGAILLRRLELRPFTDKQIALLNTFADQAVIAIENVRLFQELQERTRELVESVEEMKALSEVGQAVSSSLDLETVLETIVARAVDLSGTDCGVIYEYDEAAQEFNLRASHNMETEAVEGLKSGADTAWRRVRGTGGTDSRAGANPRYVGSAGAYGLADQTTAHPPRLPVAFNGAAAARAADHGRSDGVAAPSGRVRTRSD